MGRLTGKSVIVTGASRGIGAAAAEALAAEGAALFLLARNGAEVSALAGRLRATGAAAEAMACDVANYAAVAAAVARAEAAFGRVDGMIANAGVIDPIGALATTDPAAWGALIDVNLMGVHHCLRAVLPGMRARGGGVIVTVGSGAAQNPLEGWSAYCASKAAVLMLMRCAHLENKGKGVRLHSLSPGTVATDMQRRIKASGINPVSQMDFAQHAPAEAPGRALAWLMTEDAAEFAGQEVSLRDPAIRARVGL